MLETLKINMYISVIVLPTNHLKTVVDTIIRILIFRFSFNEV
jgi:hypothetical protein